MNRIYLLGLSLFLSGCASSASNIQAAYVSPLQYENYSCQQLAAEAQRVSHRAAQLSGVQDSNATTDAVTTTAAVILFWPAAFMIRGDGQTAAELARMKGEFEAIEKTSTQKSCGLDFRRQAAS
jgi:hypothetical protein